MEDNRKEVEPPGMSYVSLSGFGLGLAGITWDCVGISFLIRKIMEWCWNLMETVLANEESLLRPMGRTLE